MLLNGGMKNGAGVQSKEPVIVLLFLSFPSDLVFYTSSNVDLGGAGNDGAITERVRIASDGNISIGVPGANTSGGWKVKLVVPDNASYQSALNVTNNVNADCQVEIKTGESRFGPSTNTPLAFKNNTERVRISSDGKFGIGIQTHSLDSNPVVILSVVATECIPMIVLAW